eukprot:TRINITY_DN731_c0_g1_i1.p1 TRINITY_DN731_c0_g1~~TRINITY_DN731_c0_g1_i1.p1  ORF type:complete len:860 (+),score=285.37 TRINITY_DN731_c0_g1_i1:375-2582(+)
MSCAMLLDSEKLGDPAWGCAKDYKVDYKCGKFGEKMSKVISAEASGQTLQLSCSKVKAAKAVVKLIQGVQKASAEDAEKEAENYEKFEHWCTKTKKILNKNIDKAKAGIEKLTVSVDGKNQEKTKLTRDVAELTKELDDLEATAAEALKTETERNDLYESTKKDLEDTIVAVGEAVKAMEDSKPGSLAQLTQNPLVLMRISQPQQEMLLKLSDSPLTGAPASRTYDFKSGGVIDMLKNLKSKFGMELEDANSASRKAKLEYDGAKGSRDMTIKFTTESKTKKEEILATIKKELAADTSALNDLKDDLKADSTSFEQTEVQCKTRAAENKERSWQRQQEMDAMTFAVNRLQQNVASLVQTPNMMNLSTALLEQRATVAKDWAHKWDTLTDKKAPIESAKDHFTRLLAKDARDAKTSLGPVGKQIKMSIESNIASLNDAQQQDDRKMKRCNQEISENEKKVAERTEDLKTTQNEIDLAEAEVKKLTETIDSNTQKLAEKFQALHEAKMVRQEAKMENKIMVEDYEASQEAIKTAQKEIEDFYKDAVVANAFIQIKSDAKNHAKAKSQGPTEVAEAPSDSEGGFTGTGGARNAVVTVLERLYADFGKMIVDTQTKEEEEQQAFDEVFTAQEKEKARLTAEKELKTQEATRLSQQVLDKRESWKLIDREMASVSVYLADLKKDCLKTPNAADRKTARTNEIKSLNDAKEAVTDALPQGVFAQWSAKTSFLAPVGEHSGH